MLSTPATFIPLIRPQAADHPRTFVFHRGELLLNNVTLGLPEPGVLASLNLAPDRIHALGEWEGVYYQMAWLDAPGVPDGEHGYHGLRSLFGVVDEGFLGLAGRAFQLAEWARTHRYCGVCGSGTVLATGERCFKCPQCGHMAYPRISPAMMVLIRKGDQVLLAKHVLHATQRFVPLAGFLEAGESIEECITREVFEEVGLRVHNPRYFASQSWPFPHSLMLAFTADYLDGEIRVDPAEIAEARWFGPGDEWPERVPQMSISSVLIDAHRPPGT